MTRFIKSCKAFFSDRDGATTVEYCVMLAMILLVMLVGITAAGGGVKGWWTDIDNELQSNGF